MLYVLISDLSLSLICFCFFFESVGKLLSVSFDTHMPFCRWWKKVREGLCGRLVLSLIPKDVHSLICGICENVILQGKGELTDAIKLGSWDGKSILDYIRVPNINKSPYKQNSERKSHCRSDDVWERLDWPLLALKV